MFNNVRLCRPTISKTLIAGTIKLKNVTVAFNEQREEYLKAPMTEKLGKLNQMAAQIEIGSKGIEVSLKMEATTKEPSKQYLENYQKAAPEANVDRVIQEALNLNCLTDQKYSEPLGSSVKCVIAKVADGIAVAKLVQLAKLMATVLHGINLNIDMNEIENNPLEKT
jgi:hypothetical protein